ncbi:hypothetical protein GCM10025762_42230 [Haloechinothrix salitolerans]
MPHSRHIASVSGPISRPARTASANASAHSHPCGIRARAKAHNDIALTVAVVRTMQHPISPLSADMGGGGFGTSKP